MTKSTELLAQTDNDSLSEARPGKRTWRRPARREWAFLDGDGGDKPIGATRQAPGCRCWVMTYLISPEIMNGRETCPNDSNMPTDRRPARSKQSSCEACSSCFCVIATAFVGRMLAPWLRRRGGEEGQVPVHEREVEQSLQHLVLFV